MKTRLCHRTFFWVVCLALLLLLSPRSPALAQQDKTFGMSAFVHGNNFADYPSAANMQDGLGVRWARASLHWYWIQSDAAYPDLTPDFFYPDRAVDALYNEDINIVGILYEPPRWASSCPGALAPNYIFCPPADLDEFEAYVRATVAHYKDKIHHWEIWYEQNNPLSWRTGPNAAQYVQLLSRAHHAIKGPGGEDPDATIVLGALAGIDLNYLKGVHDSGGWDFIDVVAVDPIQRDKEPEFFGRADDLLRLQSLVKEFGEKPIWYTEIGWPTVPAAGGITEAEHAAYLVRDYAMSVARGTDGYFWMEFRNRGVDTSELDLHLGLLHHDLTPKLGYTTYGVLADQLGNGGFWRERDSSPGAVAADFETAESWTSGTWLGGTTSLARTSAQSKGGAFSGQWSYSFPSATGGSLVYISRDSSPLPGTPKKFTVWVLPDDGDHRLSLEFKDNGGEIFRVRIGNTIGTSWVQMQGNVADGFSLGGDGNVNYPIRFHQLVLEAYQTPDFPFYGHLSGAIYVDDIAARATSASVRDYQFADGGGGFVDVVWTTGAGGEAVAFPGAQVSTVNVSGNSSTVTDGGGGDADGVVNGQVSIPVSSSPLFVSWAAISAFVLDGFGGVHGIGEAGGVVSDCPYFGFDAAEDVEFLTGSDGFYVLDAYGGIHPGRSAPPVSGNPYFGFDIARDIELGSDTAVYMLDGFGGVHALDGAPSLGSGTPYFGFPAARDLEIAPGGYYVLDGFGGVHAGGGASDLNPSTPYFGWDIARDMELAPTGAYVLDGFGGVHAGGGAPVINDLAPYFGFDIARDLELATTGFYVLDGFGGVHAGDGATPVTSPPPPYFGFDIARYLELR